METNTNFSETLELCTAVFGTEVVNQAADEHLMEILDDIEANTGTIAQLNHEGDTKYSWNRRNKVECDVMPRGNTSNPFEPRASWLSR